MGRLTISLPDALHRALKEAAAHRDRTIGRLVAESLTSYGIKPRERAEDLVRRAREASGLAEEAAIELAVDEARRARRE